MVKVSIIVPCYKQAVYLPEALDSVLAQSYADWECIIVNDGSPDNTEEIALNYCNRDARFKYVKKVNGGLSSARNAGISQAEGIYLLPLDADDKIGSEYCEKAVQLLDDDSRIKVVYAEAVFFGAEQGKWYLPAYSFRRLLTENMIYCSAFFRKTDYNVCGGYDEHLLNGWEDWSFWIQLLKQGGEVVKLPYTGFYYRKKEVSMLADTNKNLAQQIVTRKRIYEKHKEAYEKTFGDPILSLAIHEQALQEYELRIRNIYNSKSYRLGHFLLRPFSFLKRLV